MTRHDPPPASAHNPYTLSHTELVLQCATAAGVSTFRRSHGGRRLITLETRGAS